MLFGFQRPARQTLSAFDIAFMRFVGAGVVLRPVGWWMVRRYRAQPPRPASWLGLVFGLSAAVRQTVADASAAVPRS